MPGKTWDQLQRENPQRQGESTLAYTQRIGAMYRAGQGVGPSTDLTPFVNTAIDTVKNAGKMAILGPLGLFSEQTPQGPNEPDVLYKPRAAVSGLLNKTIPSPAAGAGAFIADGFAKLPQTISNGLSTPNSRAAAPKAPPKLAPKDQPMSPETKNSWAGFKTYNQPGYEPYEQAAEAKYGLPPGLLARIRTSGEKTNPGIISSAGARTPYQIIGPTRAGIMNQEKFDPWISPKNAALGAAYVLRQNFDRTGDWGQAVRAYNGGFGPQSAENKNTSDSYMARVMGGFQEGMAGAPPGYDPTYANKQLGEIANYEKAAMTPFSMERNLGPAPEIPTLKTVDAPDFTKAQEQLKAAEPAIFTEAEQRRTRRSSMFGAMGQALASLPESAGVGKILAVVGGAALAGRAAGDKEIQARMDKYDEDMARWHMAMASQDNFEAQKAYEAASANAAVMNQQSMLKFQQATKIWESNSNVQFSQDGTSVITSIYDPKSGVQTTRTAPIAAAIKAKGALLRSQVFGGMSGDANAVNRMDRQAYTSLVVGAAAAEAANAQPGSQEQTDAIGTGVAFTVGQMFDDGRGPEMVKRIFGKDGDAQWENLSKEATKVAGQQGYTQGTKEFAEAVSNYMQGQIASAAMSSPEIMRNVLGLQGQAMSSLNAQRLRGTTTTTRAGPKGVTTTSRAEAQ